MKSLPLLPYRVRVCIDQIHLPISFLISKLIMPQIDNATKNLLSLL